MDLVNMDLTIRMDIERDLAMKVLMNMENTDLTMKTQMYLRGTDLTVIVIMDHANRDLMAVILMTQTVMEPADTILIKLDLKRVKI